MKQRPIMFAALAIAGCTASPASAGERGWAHASSIGRDALVVASLGIPAVQGDWEGDKEAVLSLGGAFLVTTAQARAMRNAAQRQLSFPSAIRRAASRAAAQKRTMEGGRARSLSRLRWVARVKAPSLCMP